MKLSKITVFSVLCSFLSMAYAQIAMIELRYRMPETLLPILSTQFASRASISAYGNQLIINAQPEMVAQIRAMVEKLDTPPQQLLLKVRMKDQQNSQRQQAQASGTYCKDGVCVSNSTNRKIIRQNGAQITIHDQNKTSQQNTIQKVRAIDGHAAYISLSQSVPITNQNISVNPYTGVSRWSQTQYESLVKGVYVLPRVIGNEVVLDIKLSNDALLDKPLKQSNGSTLQVTPKGTSNQNTQTQRNAPQLHRQNLITQVRSGFNTWVSLGQQQYNQNDKNSGLGELGKLVQNRLANYEIYVEKVPQTSNSY